MIGMGAFYDCRSLSSVTFPEGLRTIRKMAFCMNETRAAYAYKGSKGKKTSTLLKTLKLPASLVEIGDQAFGCCDALTSVVFAKNSELAELGGQAFTACFHLKEIALPDSLQRIGEQAFALCFDLKKADLGQALTKIDREAFHSCSSLVSLTVPDTLTEIGENILEDHGEKLVVTCGEGSAMEAYLKQYYPDVQISYPKK